MKRILAALLLFLFSVPTLGATIPGQIILYRSGAIPLPQNPLATWAYSSNAYSAIAYPFDQIKAAGPVAGARFVAIWRANSVYANTGVSLAVCPAQSNAENGLKGCHLLIYFSANDTTGAASYAPGCVSNPGGPFPCAADITSALNDAIANTPSGRYLILMTYGNGTTGPLVYVGELNIQWKIP